eukprot:m.264130 g.264130  ORF g.264130 m.264130 type:complete len:184 (-) comp54655_c0_seq22:81-632(-)
MRLIYLFCVSFGAAPELSVVQQRVYDILKDHIVIGHQLTEDLKSLMLNFPKKKTCDIALYAPIQTLVLGSEREDDKLPSLRQISQILLGLWALSPFVAARTVRFSPTFFWQDWSSVPKTCRTLSSRRVLSWPRSQRSGGNGRKPTASTSKETDQRSDALMTRTARQATPKMTSELRSLANSCT